ncbi:AAA domain-containing protein [Cristinia sonorae]|uniref:DNA repair protein RAD50 n=1 Tax=Cristinia sonorae TaxID=1940300 RepID=A0A8K0XT33_9AGAR|nr:AAA domain-containing protein [Cristinia sonorae]
MACLNKLAIRGIRAFDDKQIAIIEFFTPVTVIVGHNGSGKTTIIECLKYATTGDQPPNTRGGAFIHDPKMANEKEVKAQVKLRFHAANGQRMLAVRNLSVTMKKTGAMTMKTLESILALADGNSERAGKRAAISTKCAEMDAEIPNLLGVSKAVLENVIFCHQEDSYWPLSEPATLKKKFDEIFEATKYTKALDSIKSLRKDRMAELKAEKERLEGLSREKSHADKLKTRITDLQNAITQKELEHEEAKEEYERLVAANQRFYDSATKFRETYTRVETLERTKGRYEADLADARENLQELHGTDEELASRLRNFDEHISEQKRKKRGEESKQQDLEDDLAKARKSHVNEMSEQGRLQAQIKVQEQQLAEREDLIREIAAKHQMKGYDHSPLGRDEILDFIGKLSDLQKSQNRETERLQNEGKRMNDEFNTKLRQLTGSLEKHRQNRELIRENASTLQARITQEEEKVDNLQNAPAALRRIQDDLADTDKRIGSSKAFIKEQNYDDRLSEKTTKIRHLEIQRDALTEEMRGLSLQADSRVRLDVNRTTLKSKTNQLDVQMEFNKAKFMELVGSELNADTMERELDRSLREREREVTELENASITANQELKSAETTISSLNKEVEEKKSAVKKLDRQIKAEFKRYLDETEDELWTVETLTLGTLIKDCSTELMEAQKALAQMTSLTALWDSLLQEGRTSKCCPMCERSMDSKLLQAFEGVIKRRKENASKENPEYDRQTREDEVKAWGAWVDAARRLEKVEKESKDLSTIAIPELEKKLANEHARLSELRDAADAASIRVEETKKKVKELSKLKQEAALIFRTKDEIEELAREVTNLERDLAISGSTKTTEEVQNELDTLTTEIRSLEREKHQLATEKERHLNTLRDRETEHMRLQVRESELRSQAHEKEMAEKRVIELKDEQTRAATQAKELDTLITDAQAPIKQLELTHQKEEKEWSNRISEAQSASQALNMNVDSLAGMNKRVERLAKEKVSKQLDKCNERIQEYEAKIQSLNGQVEAVRAVVQSFEKEISDAGAAMANLRENIRVRKLMKDIAATAAEIATYDMEEAAKAKRIFQEKYSLEKEKETQMQSKYAHIGGELSSAQGQLKTLESDMKEFKDVGKRYREQLVKVKLSDMANNDLEKYAKALDNAIMKYHSLKMEEVNDTMRHLWNKTYQGTDIDGIKISSDNDGGTTKRSYNYRVVMTKDNVEMDMRGRCSAGQKMLASIIIRLALADSFGQNCGILALDEPTNALDTENIDALAASLVDIINERKSQGHFQLIIITHDENFLRKLGQADVMEYYWRVARDSRQKSIIERHRFS